jgi:hypothetical protein
MKGGSAYADGAIDIVSSAAQTKARRKSPIAR